MDSPPILTSSEISLIKTSWEQIQDNPQKVRKIFYLKIFEIEPEARKLFRETFLSFDSLPDSFLFMREHLDNLEKEIPRIKRLGLKHKTYGVKKKYYPIGQTALLWTFQQIMKDKFTTDMINAWAKLFEFMAHYLILGMRRK
ncbi:MAG: globin domain-containing protein [Candidatus Heimdallarchaeota archaeon]